ncbi:Hypothetical protein A7982_11089 [Minicystis rosea]|nr:Hypothetical protein A7982_11089 [Minicystis rosea]
MSDPLLDELWHRVLDTWTDDAAHAAFLDHCRKTQQLGQGAAHYREEVRRASAYREDPTRVESAQKRLNAIAMLAMLDLDTRRTAPETARLQTTGVVLRWVAGLLFVGIALITAARFLAK